MYEEDPRLTGEYVRRIAAPDDGGPVTLVGVVHDHPASIYRTRRVVEATDPAVLGLELPPLAVPLFETRANQEARPATSEFGAAVRAASTDRVVGIDGPSVRFAGRFVRRLVAERPSLATVRSAARSLWSVTKHAARCRFAAVVDRSGAAGSDGTTAHDGLRSDDPATQADDERTRVRRAMTVANALGDADAGGVRRRTREAHMTARLRTLRRDGAVAAVVGIAHLGPVAEALGADRPATGSARR